MQTKLSAEFKDTVQGNAADAILRSCVHCGFCNATCPTYQILGNELDGPRGRIYLIKQMLEGADVGRSTQVHLDRCLTCLNCETTCPSGVEYGKLVSIGRALVEARVPRPAFERLKRFTLKEGLTSIWFAPLLKLGRVFRGLLPAQIRQKIPPLAGPRAGIWPTRSQPRKMLLLAGCVQPALLPNINSATARVLDAAGIQTVIAPNAGCCGALREHLSDPAGALAQARHNIDAWWPWLNDGTAEAIIANASACGLAIKEYGAALRDDADYAEKAHRVSQATRDVSELLPELVAALRSKVRADKAGRITCHTPCTLQHGQKLRGGVAGHLSELGFEVTAPPAESHLCCGSAGTYSVLQPMLATQLRDRKLAHLAAQTPERIASANVGCIQHLQSGTSVPVVHWIEILDAALDAP